MTAEEESAVIAKVLDGDSPSFEALVLDNQKKVYNLAFRLTGDGNDALDVSQESFLRAYTHLGTFKGECRFGVWLYRITYNICTDLLRKRARESSYGETVSLSGYGEEREIEIPDVRELPEDALLRRELSDAVSEGIALLPPMHRQILLLREVSGMSYCDIASVIGLSEGTVKSRLSRARDALARILEKNGTIQAKIRHKKKATDGEASGR
ncbi:MAG: RNA polymerase sigma factor [Oscillospiraceae bacterium]|nr:RNA polymerase sigma factor [Oscillospiraceae bacterium]